MPNDAGLIVVLTHPTTGFRMPKINDISFAVNRSIVLPGTKKRGVPSGTLCVVISACAEHKVRISSANSSALSFADMLTSVMPSLILTVILGVCLSMRC